MVASFPSERSHPRLRRPSSRAQPGEFIMARPVTLFTGQWADLTLEVICQKASRWGYDGIELPCWGDHFSVRKALNEPNYCKGRHELLANHGLKCWAISTHLTGQLVLDHIYTTERELKAINHRPEFGFNFDPSPL